MLGPRWFIPQRYRCHDPNEYDYTESVPNSMLEKARKFLRNESEADEEMVCTICLHPVYINIDADGNIVE